MIVILPAGRGLWRVRGCVAL